MKIEQELSELARLKDPTLPAAERVLPYHQLLGLLDKSRRHYLIGGTSGSFDIMHHGHTRYIEKLVQVTHQEACFALKVPLVVIGVNSDESTRRNKGHRTNGRPVLEEECRAELVAALRGVDLTFIFDDDMQLARLRPDIFQVYTESDHKPDARPEIDEMIRNHTKIAIGVPEVPYSTSSILRKIRENQII